MSVLITPTQAPAPWLVLDIETGDADPSAIQIKMDAWNPPKNWKPETVEAKRTQLEAEAAESAKRKAALLDASPILCIGVRSPSMGLMISGMGQGHLSAIPGWSAVIETDNEAEMLAALYTALMLHTDEATQLVGHHIIGFDLPKIRCSYIRHRQPLPACLKPTSNQPVADTMRLFRYFSMEHRDAFAVSLDTVCRTFHVPLPKTHVKGSDVPEMHKQGRIAEILTYCALDVDATAEVYRLMMA